jgi:hypothetical protein
VHGLCAVQPTFTSALGAGPLPPIVFERESGAAATPLPSSYQRHEPEKTALYGVISDHIETFLDAAREQSSSGTGCPAFIEREFRRYLGCGILANGFARLRCPSCGFERLVAFSCKGRICPSCWARRMGDTAAHLVDRVLPEVDYRQWVLTFPWELRLTLAMNRGLLSEMLSRFLATLFAWQRRRGRALGIRGGTGAVTFIQRFGGALNTNPHFHSIVPDGLFIVASGGRTVFEPLPPPSDDDVAHLAGVLAARLGAIAEGYCRDREGIRPDNDDGISMMRAAAAEARFAPLTGECAGGESSNKTKPLCGKVDGFTLHAARVVKAGDREGLERLCRYGLRAPFALDRFSIDPDGSVRYRLTRPWPTPAGRTELLFEPQALLRRLAALLPGPYFNLVRYHGVFANRSRYRGKLPPPRSAAVEPKSACHPCEDGGLGIHHRRLGWAQLLRRVLDVDVLTCAKCAAPMVVIAFLTDPGVIARILDHLKLPSEPPPPAESRLPAADEYFDAPPPWDESHTEWPEPAGQARDPP